jgi:hypothetical protein
MRATTEKDYIDARDAALMSALQEYSARTDTRLAEMEARVLRALNDMQKWVAGIVLAGVTVSTSVTAYMQSSNTHQMQAFFIQTQASLSQMQTEIRKIQQTPSQPPPQSAPIIIYPQAPPPFK